MLVLAVVGHAPACLGAVQMCAGETSKRQSNGPDQHD